MEEIAKEIKSLEEQIDIAGYRADEAWKIWDAEAYEGACATGDRLYARLQELRGKLK